MGVFRDDAYDVPMNVCSDCKREVSGFVEDPEKRFVCEDCNAIVQEAKDILEELDNHDSSCMCKVCFDDDHERWEE